MKHATHELTQANLMSHTHFLYHIVFGTKDRMPLIDTEWERRLYAPHGWHC